MFLSISPSLVCMFSLNLQIVSSVIFVALHQISVATILSVFIHKLWTGWFVWRDVSVMMCYFLLYSDVWKVTVRFHSLFIFSRFRL